MKIIKRLACLSISLVLSGPAFCQRDVALPVIDFLNSIGVNSAISTRGETLAQTSAAINYTGIRWIRTGYEGNIPVKDLIELHKQTGVKYSYGLLSGGTDIPRLLKGGRQLWAQNCLFAIEGLNEPNNWGITYQQKQGGGKNSWLQVAQLQHDLYVAVKADKYLHFTPVLSISENGAETDNVGLQYLTIPAGAHTLMPDSTIFADYANVHNYITHPSWPGLHDNQTWIAASHGADSRVDGFYGNYVTTWNKKFKGYSVKELPYVPRVTTETGITIDNTVTEEAHASLLLNMYLAQFKQGCRYTAVYLLRDRSDETGNQQFGFYTKDYKPRKAAVYLHNLTTILRGGHSIKKADFGPHIIEHTVPYTIVNQPATVHNLLLEGLNNNYILIIWGERLNGSDTIQLQLPGKTRQLTIYDPTTGIAPIRTASSDKPISLTLSNHPLIIDIPK